MKDLITLPGKIHTSQIIGLDTVNITYSELKTLRDNGELIEGKFYRITDYVTTVNEITITNARSAGHQFDLLVRADSANTLNEQAWAMHHDGDTYFSRSNLEAWELKYKLDNEKWSSRICTIIKDKNDGYRASSLGTVDIDGQTYILWDASEFTEDYDFSFLVSLTKEEGADMWVYDPYTGEKGEDTRTSISTIIAETTDEGTGTILQMKDEFGNECPYDFKNIQFKRWRATDSVSVRIGLNNYYMIANYDNCPKGLSVKDQNDFIWAFTFSSNRAGGEQTDYSLGGHEVHHNHFSENRDGSIPNNVFYGQNNYQNKFGFDCFNNSWGNDCYNNSWGNVYQNNSWGNNCYRNSWGNRCTYNSWGNGCNNNSWGNGCSRNSWGNNCNNNSWGNNCNNNSWGNGCSDNSWGNQCFNNSWGNDCYNNSWGNSCQSNSWGNEITQSTVFDGVQYTQITTEKVKNIQVLNGLAGTSSSKISLSFVANKDYTQVAAKNSAGELKIYVPGDLA